MLKAAERAHPHVERSDDLAVPRSSRRSQNRTTRAYSRSCRRQLLGVSVRSSSHTPVFVGHGGPETKRELIAAAMQARDLGATAADQAQTSSNRTRRP